LLFSIRPVAVPVLIVAGNWVAQRHRKTFARATTVLPLTLIVTICADWPTVKLTVPLGKLSPVKLEAEAGSFRYPLPRSSRLPPYLCPRYE